MCSYALRLTDVSKVMIGRARLRLVDQLAPYDSDRRANGWLESGKDPEALQFVMRVDEGKQRTSTFDVDGHTFIAHCAPFAPQELLRELGLHRTE